MFAAQPKPIIASDPVPLTPTPSDILEQIGTQLRQLREQRKLSIEDISAQTQIQPRLVQAIEEGHLEMLPESVYVKGMVKRYGNSVGIDGLAISQQVPTWDRQDLDFTQPTVRQNNTGFTTPQTGFSTPQVKPLHVYLGYTLAIIGAGAGISHLLNTTLRPKPAIVNGSNKLPKNSAIVPAPIATVAPKIAPLPNVNVGIEVKSPAWAQIGVDGTTRFTGSLKVGTKLNLVATKQVTISTDNAGGLLFAQEQQPPQPLGKLGQKQHVTIKVGKASPAAPTRIIVPPKP
jgi:Helix-turn-helix domain/Domain of unknown function (DUF4115)